MGYPTDTLGWSCWQMVYNGWHLAIMPMHMRSVYEGAEIGTQAKNVGEIFLYDVRARSPDDTLD